MSRSEKRNFRLYTQKYRDGEKKYWLLFTKMQRQSHYDEKALKAAVADEFEDRSFAAAKNYLWNLLNDFLLIYAPENHKYDQCRRCLDRAHLLHQRGIVSAARKELRTAHKIADEYEFIDLQLQLNRLERNILKLYQRKKFQQALADLLSTQTALKARREEREQQEVLYDRLGIYIRLNLSQLSAEHLREIEAVAQHPALQPDYRPAGFTARRLYLQSRCFLLGFHEQREQEFTAYRQLLAHWEAHPHQQEELYPEFRLFLCNFLHCAANNSRYDAFAPVLDRLESLPVESEEDEIEAFSVGLFYRHLLALNERRLDDALALMATVPEKLDRYGTKLVDSTRLGFQANLLLTHFWAGDFRQANHWAEQLQRHPLTQQRVDLQGLARIFSVVTAYELVDDGDYEHLISRAKAGAEWLRKKGLARSFARSVLNGMVRLMQRGDPKARHNVIRQLHDELEQMSAQKLRPGMEEVLYWTKSKLLGRQIADLIR
ncbi:MAG: hypothetical protein AAGN35_10675 [Bacteroidota bacterium]